MHGDAPAVKLTRGRNNFDGADQRADRFARFDAGVRRGERRLQVRHAGAVELGGVRMHGDDFRCGAHAQLGAERGGVGFGRLQLLGQQGGAGVDQLLGDAVGAAAGFGQVAFQLAAAAGVVRTLGVQLFVVAAHGFADQLGIQHAALQAGQHAGVELLGGVGAALGAGAALADVGAAELPFADDREAAAARPAPQQPGQQALRALPRLRAGRRADAAPARLSGQPELLFDDAQVRRGDDHPIGFRIDQARAPPGLGVLHEAPAVEHDAAAIEFVAEDPVADARIAVERRRPPRPAARRRRGVVVQRLGDRQRRHALHVILEDADDDRGFARFDLAAAAHFAFKRAVAVAAPAGDAPRARHADLAAAHFLRQVGEELLGDDALQPGDDRCHLAVGDGVDLDVVAGGGAADEVHVRLIARETIDRFRQHRLHASPAHIGDQRLQLWARRHAGAGERRVGVHNERADDASARGEVLARRDLIIDRALGLQVRRIAGVDGGGHSS